MALFSVIVVSIMSLFSIIAIIDNVFLKDKLELGPKFMEGMEMIGPLCVAIVGIISIVPVFAWMIEHTITPLYKTFGLDPSMACTAILAIDMGGYQLAESVALDPLVGKWAGIIYGSMMGATIVFSIPVGLAAIKDEDVAAFSKGILFGIAAIPLGTFIGGILLKVPLVSVIKNLIIPIIFSAIIIICLAKWPKQTTNLFKKFSTIINVVAMLGLALAILKDLVLLPMSDLGFINIDNIPVIRLLAPTAEGIAVAGAVGIVLSGALPFIHCLNKWLQRPLASISKSTGISDVGVTGFLLSCANNMATFAELSKMKEREKVLNVAFAVCAAFVIGDHLAFVAANSPETIAPMMIAKLVSGIFAIILALIFTKKEKEEA